MRRSATGRPAKISSIEVLLLDKIAFWKHSRSLLWVLKWLHLTILTFSQQLCKILLQRDGLEEEITLWNRFKDHWLGRSEL